MGLLIDNELEGVWKEASVAIFWIFLRERKKTPENLRVVVFRPRFVKQVEALHLSQIVQGIQSAFVHLNSDHIDAYVITLFYISFMNSIFYLHG